MTSGWRLEEAEAMPVSENAQVTEPYIKKKTIRDIVAEKIRDALAKFTMDLNDKNGRKYISICAVLIGIKSSPILNYDGFYRGARDGVYKAFQRSIDPYQFVTRLNYMHFLDTWGSYQVQETYKAINSTVDAYGSLRSALNDIKEVKVSIIPYENALVIDGRRFDNAFKYIGDDRWNGSSSIYPNISQKMIEEELKKTLAAGKPNSNDLF